MYKDKGARIISKQSWGDYYLLEIESPRIASQASPGQFIMVRVSPQPFPLLRRPFSIHSREGENLTIFFQMAGPGTRALSKINPDDFIDIIGPLGNGFKIAEGLAGKEIALIGGGRGIAPLYFLTQEASRLSIFIKVFYGGRNIEDLPLREKFEKTGFTLYCSTDDGSFGFKGLVSDLFAKELKNFRPSCVYSCGPEPMLERIARVLLANEIPGEFSLESMMGCGFGACLGCVKKFKKNGREGWYKVCQDGPVFSLEEIIWKDEERK